MSVNFDFLVVKISLAGNGSQVLLEVLEQHFHLHFMPGINKDKEIKRCLENKGWRKDAIKQAWVR
ncbi:MAG: hypothetical protein EP297_00310 [Gammaproteobacteria bacterium]|nr:MAG: hypothetical protein EP297_00310 [Gammaproteobacteria bacterium]